MTDDTTVQIDGTLRNASIFEGMSGRRANGDLYGDRKGRFADGTNVTTSTILSGPDEQGIIHTRNSVYRVELRSAQEGAAK